MPHDNTGHIFRSGIYGVEIADIEAVLGVTGDIGTLCTSQAINMWNLNKPVRLNDVLNLLGNWQAGRDGDYGISAHSLGSASLGIAALYDYSYNGGLNGWAYNPPRGRTYNEWTLNLFFDGYYHGAPEPWYGWTGPNAPVPKGTDAWFGLDDVVTASTSINYSHIQLSDGITTKSLANCYFGVAIFSGSTCIAIKVCQNTMGAGSSGRADADWSCGFDTTNWNTGTYTAIPFFWASNGGASATPENSGVLYTIPYTSPKTFTVTAPVQTATMMGTCGIDEPSYSASTMLMGFAPQFTINKSGTYTLTSMTLQVRCDAGSGGSTWSYSTPLGFSATVDANSGVPWDLVSSAYDSSITGLTNCDPQREVNKIQAGYKYYVDVTITVKNYQNVSETFSETYEIDPRDY